MTPLFAILHEDADLLVVNKPAGLVCHPTKGDAYSSLISRVRLHLGANSEPRLVNRLDRETSGVIVAVKTGAAAAELGRVWETRAVFKSYLAIVHGHLKVEQLLVDAPLGKDEASPVAIKDCVRPDGAMAQTSVFVQRRFTRDGRPFTLLRAEPLTGRKPRSRRVADHTRLGDVAEHVHRHNDAGALVR